MDNHPSDHMLNDPEGRNLVQAIHDRKEFRSDLQWALNWASIDAAANTPDFELAEKIISAPSLAGYRKPRVIETPEELKALPYGIVVLSDGGTIAERFDDKFGLVFGDDQPFPWNALALPVTVLFEVAK